MEEQPPTSRSRNIRGIDLRCGKDGGFLADMVMTALRPSTT